MSTVTFDELFSHVHESAKTALESAEGKFLKDRDSGRWSHAFRWSAETLLVKEAIVIMLDRAVAAAEANPEGQTLRGALMYQIDHHLDDVWGLSRSTSPFSNLAEDAFKVASADLKRTFEDVE